MRQPSPLLVLPLILASACAAGDPAPDPLAFRDATVASADGVPIRYRHGGRGDTALVFVHGWLGDASVWEASMRRFAPEHRVVALDLAGHGASGAARTDWTVDAFAGDVSAVVRALDLERVVLVGHSMAGTIAVAAANALGERTVLVVPVDSLQDVEWDLPPEVWAEFFGGLRADFPSAVEGFFRGILAAPGSPPAVIDAIVASARAAEPERSVAMLERARAFDLHGALRALRAPVHVIASDRNSVALETNRRYAPAFDADVVTGVGHWPHLEDPAGFAAALARVLAAHDLE